MRASLDALRQSLPSLIQNFALAVDPNLSWNFQSVYQYTRFSTIRGMLGGEFIDSKLPPARPTDILKSIWATSSAYLNDSKEFHRGKDVIEPQLASLPNDRVRRTMALAFNDADPLDVYCACFSAVDDDLSQWRGYGDNGAGVSIKYALIDLDDMDGVGYWVLYGKPGSDHLQVQVAIRLVNYIYSAVSALLPPAPVPGAVYAEIREQLTELWPALFLAFKHGDFEAEAEFRIVYSEAVGRSLPRSFRPGPVIPFVKLRRLNGELIPVTGIRLGPGVSAKENIRSLEMLLKSLKLGHISVSPSDIPYVPR